MIIWIILAARTIREGVKKIDGLYILGKQQGSIVAFSSTKINIFQLMHDLAKKKKWILGPIQFPSGIHISVTHTHVGQNALDLVKVNESAHA